MVSGGSCMDLSRIIEVKIGESPPNRLDRALAEFLPAGELLSRTRITSLIRGGAVSCGGETASDPSQKAMPGETWRVVLQPPEDSGLVAEDLEIAIVYEDHDLLVVNKAAGMVVHPAKGNWTGTLVNGLLHHCGKQLLGVGDVRRPGIVHRLDKDTSGLLVVAKSERAADSLSRQFEQRTVSRSYLAVVRGCPDSRSSFAQYPGAAAAKCGFMRIEGDIARHPTNRLKMAVVAGGGRFAATRVRPVQVFANRAVSLVECRLETGRTHQIRVHLEHVGHPLIGDPLYGTGSRALPASIDDQVRHAVAAFGRQALHAATLAFEHPGTKARREFESPLPEDMVALLDVLSQG